MRAEEQNKLAGLPLQPALLEPALYGKSETKRTVSNIVTAVTRGYNNTFPGKALHVLSQNQ